LGHLEKILTMVILGVNFMATKYFETPFANSGDKTSIPDASQPSGNVSFEEGWGPDYAKDQATDPTAKDIPRQSENYFKFTVTEALKEIQERGFKPYDPLVNYPVGAFIPGSDNILYKSAIKNGPAVDFLPVVDPVGDLTGTWETSEVLQATETVAGKAEIATQAETDAITDDSRFVTPLKLGGSVGVANSPLIKTALNALGSAPIYACRAWVNFNGTGVVAIRASGNVSSVTDNNVGDYTVNFITPIEDTDYSPQCTGVSVSDQSAVYGFATKVLSSIGAVATLKTTSAYRVLSRRESDVDLAEANVAIFR
jgi:hypothetical protein